MQGTKYDIFNIKSEQVKFNAFFQYLKSFSETGLDTLQKLEAQFNKQMRNKLKHNETLAIIKTLLSSYQIFILQIKDSCDFVQISEFGYCIGKTFLQLLKIIKWFLRSWLKDSRKYQKLKASLQNDQNSDAQGMNSPARNVCAFCEQIIKSNPYGKDMRNKRKGKAMVDMGSELREAKRNYKTQVNHLIQFKDQVLQKYTLKQFQSKRFIGDNNDADILNRKHVAMKLQMSNNQSVLQQVLNQFNVKTEALARFVNCTQAGCIQDFKMNRDSDYSHFEEQMKQVISQKIRQAKQKMKELMQARILQHQKNKKDRLNHIEVQTLPVSLGDTDKGQTKIKQLNLVIQKMKNQLECEKALSQSLKKLLQSKSIQFQVQFLNYRKQVIQQSKSKHYLKSLISMKDTAKQQNYESKQPSIRVMEDNNIDVLEPKKPTRKILSGFIKEKDKSKNINSIKFTLEDEQDAAIDNTSLFDRNSNVKISSQHYFQDCKKRSVQVQTDPINITQDSPQWQNKIQISHKVSFNDNNSRPKSLFRESKKDKISSALKSQTQLYSHIRSKIYQHKQNAKPFRKQLKPTRSSFMGNLAKKLAPETINAYQTEELNKQIKLFKITCQPVFSILTAFRFSRLDLYNIYIDDKHTYHYQNIIYRNKTHSSNFNSKRGKPNNTSVQLADQQQIYKKEFAFDDKIQAKISNALYQQLCFLKRSCPPIYQQIKQILRSPFEVSKRVDVVQLQGNTAMAKDIEIGQLRKMINLLLRFHYECVGEHKDMLCEHIIKFYDKLGVKLIKE